MSKRRRIPIHFGDGPIIGVRATQGGGTMCSAEAIKPVERTFTQSEVDVLLAERVAAAEREVKNVMRIICDGRPGAALALVMRDYPEIAQMITDHSRTVWDRSVAATKRKADVIIQDKFDRKNIATLEVPYED